jgi:hypothetical protein
LNQAPPEAKMEPGRMAPAKMPEKHGQMREKNGQMNKKHARTTKM